MWIEFKHSLISHRNNYFFIALGDEWDEETVDLSITYNFWIKKPNLKKPVGTQGHNPVQDGHSFATGCKEAPQHRQHCPEPCFPPCSSVTSTGSCDCCHPQGCSWHGPGLLLAGRSPNLHGSTGRRGLTAAWAQSRGNGGWDLLRMARMATGWWQPGPAETLCGLADGGQGSAAVVLPYSRMVPSPRGPPSAGVHTSTQPLLPQTPALAWNAAGITTAPARGSSPGDALWLKKAISSSGAAVGSPDICQTPSTHHILPGTSQSLPSVPPK